MKFTKMHGCGNDYVYINCFEEAVSDAPELARRMSDRHFGVGSDGLVLIMPAGQQDADLRMRMFNSDGSEAEMCGNAVRCVGKLAFERGIAKMNPLRVQTAAGLRVLDMTVSDGKVELVRVDMGRPIFERGDIPMIGPAGNVIDEELTAGSRTFRVTCLSMGNPHCVIYVDDVETFDVHGYGRIIENHAAFPNRVNVEFAQITGPGEILLRVWERGAGETLACGTGASAACVAGVLSGRTQRKLTAHLAGGDLELEWPEQGNVFMTGPAVEVFTGEWPDYKCEM